MLSINSVRSRQSNTKFDSLFDEYVGRNAGGYQASVLANPFKIGKDGNREEVIAKYRVWLWNEMQKQEDVWDALVWLAWKYKKQGRLTLWCWCYPQKCHAEIIKNAIEWMIREGYIQ